MGATHGVRHAVAEGLVRVHKAAGHVGRVGKLGPVHEVVHGGAPGVSVGEVEITVSLVTVTYRCKQKKPTNNKIN